MKLWDLVNDWSEVGISWFINIKLNGGSNVIKGRVWITKQNRSNLPILLIYYNFRGIGQMIRYLLVYLNIDFIDIMLDEY
jgi:hypothetical protein